MFKRDYLIRQLEKLGALVARILKLKREGNLEEAFDELTTAFEELFAKHKHLIAYADSQTLATMLADEALLRALAVLTSAEAELFEAKGDPVTATMKRVRALELYLENGMRGSRTDDGDAIRALVANVPAELIGDRYRPHLPK